MATTFLEPGGDADFGLGFWGSTVGAPAIVTDFVHGSHVKSIQFRPNAAADQVQTATVLSGNSGRLSVWVYIVAIPSSGPRTIIISLKSDGSTRVFRLRITSSGVLQLWDSAQLGSSGSTLSTGIWYRLSIAWNITSTTVNQITTFVNGVQDIAVTNVTLGNTGAAQINFGNNSASTDMNLRMSDFYIDDSNAMTDPGNIWVTAKRPNANGSNNQWTTQIGSGGSGYGTGHSPQVNERPESDTNGWSIQNAAKQTEEYSIESVSQGDINITGATIVDFMGWVKAKVGVNSTGNIIVAGTATNISVTTTSSFFTQIAGSTTYPAGNTDIGMDTNTVNQLFSLYACGIIVAYIPALTNLGTNRLLMGVGT